MLLHKNDDGERIDLQPLHEKILYAEKHRKNYDINFSLKYDPKLVVAQLIQAVEDVMNYFSSLKARIVYKNGRYAFVVDHSVRKFRSELQVKGTKLDVFSGESLAKYSINEQSNTLDFLFHHLIFDGESLPIFINALEKRIVDGVLPTLGNGILPVVDVTEVQNNALDEYRAIVQEGRHSRKTDISRLVSPISGTLILKDHAWRALGSLSKKMRTTKFGVIAFVAMLLSKRNQSFVGVVVSRRDQRTQAEMVGNLTDVAPCVLRLDEQLDFGKNARAIFRQIIDSIGLSVNVTYDEYMNLVGGVGYDWILSYTKLNDPIQYSATFSELVLGNYLYKFDNHLQFNEFEDGLTLEFHYQSPLMQQICNGLEDALLSLDKLDPSNDSLQNIEIAKSTISHVLEQGNLVEKEDGIPRTIDEMFLRYNDNDLLLETDITSFEIAGMITEVYERFGVQLSYHDIYAAGTFRDLKAKVNWLIQEGTSELEDQTCLMEYRVPGCGKAIFIDSFRMINSSLYDVKYAYRLKKGIELEQLRDATEQVVMNNDIFFTSFSYDAGEVVATIDQNRSVNIKSIEINCLSTIEQFGESLRIQGNQKLWDINLVHELDSDDWYLYIHMHHLLIDHQGIGIFLKQVEDCYGGRAPKYTQFVEMVRSYESAVVVASEHWRPLLPYAKFAKLGKPALGKGTFQQKKWTVLVNNRNFEEMEYEVVKAYTFALSSFFSASECFIGSVYHGRVIPNANSVIGSFVRILPVFYSSRQEKVLRESLQTARRNQAVSIYELHSTGFSSEYPSIVFQTLIEEGDDKNEGLFNHTVEFSGLSKFQIFLNWHIRNGEHSLHLYIDDELYNLAEANELIYLLEKALDDGGLRDGKHSNDWANLCVQ
ncbi:hypothetical protein I6N90_19935 [Paenibacillus sp. GSMTC-2017]|uniref:condensation domain-containing protein n=1 Tax=Paenibacillus sp. GSMTC-2017 TaxID=2794350 RepID=UPI0018D984BE|nr:condensation domain-containing protein [Paenibacillus sp. GSMTC-2017]MBH5320077.1 hypothetical protein [Paenibacillus sp. GSMTC-2017]